MKFRIVTDSYAGFEVQRKYRFWPFWVQCGRYVGCTNTHRTIEEAEDFAKRYAERHSAPRAVKTFDI